MMAHDEEEARRSRGRPPVPIERHPERFEIACWRAFTEMGLDPFPAARLALLATKGGPITLEDIEGVLNKASATIPLPPFDPDDPDKGLRQLAAKAKRQRPSEWLVQSSALIQELVIFIFSGNVTGMMVTLDALNTLGWGPVLMGLVKRIETALKSNLPPADPEKLSPAARRLLARVRQKAKK